MLRQSPSMMTDTAPDPDPDIAALLAELGGAKTVAATTGVCPSSVRNWPWRGLIPKHHFGCLLSLALAHGIPLDVLARAHGLTIDSSVLDSFHPKPE